MLSQKQQSVAEFMAPHVNDPYNKDAVLKQIEFLWERHTVAKAWWK
jgi:hypothetical protein